MKKTTFLFSLRSILIVSLAYSFLFTAAAQNYYPAEIGNIWVLESVDGEERSTYTLEASETAGGEKRILLKIRTEELSTGEFETDQYFLTVGAEAIELHRIVLEDAVAVLTADFPTPATFFPLQLELGDKWQIVADAEVMLVAGLTITGKSTTNLEVVGFEDVVTPAGTFENCVKVRLALTLTTPFLNLDSTTYQWFASDIGPIQYENSESLIFGLVSSNLLTVPEEPETAEEDVISEPPPEEEVMPEAVPYDVTGDGVVNILDLTFVAARLGESDSDADVTGDGTVNVLDLVRIAQNLSN